MGPTLGKTVPFAFCHQETIWLCFVLVCSFVCLCVCVEERDGRSGEVKRGKTGV